MGSDGRFSDIPTCSDINECLVKNGGCEGICRNLPGTMQCSCPKGEILTGKNCTKPQERPPQLPVSTVSHFNKAAVVIGSFFAFTLIGTVSIVVILLMKYHKAQRADRNPMSRITFQEKPPPAAVKVFDNPGMSHT